MSEETTGLAEAIDKVRELADAARGVEQLKLPGDKTGRVALVGPDGKVDFVQTQPSWIHDNLDTPAELAKYIALRGGKDSFVTIRPNLIRFVEHHGDRRDRAECELVVSPQYRLLLENAKSRLTQKEIISLLRITYRGCLERDGALVNLLRNLKWSGSGVDNASIQHGRESLGRQVEQTVSGESALPDEFSLNIPVFDNHPFRVTVWVALDIDPETKSFYITPYPQELKKAMTAALEDIRFTLTPSDAKSAPPVLLGLTD